MIEPAKRPAKPSLRWVTLAEVVALAGVVIAGLTLWNNWQDRRLREADRQAVQSVSVAQDRVALRGTVDEGGRRLTLSDPAHDLTEVSATFPAALDVSAQSPADSTLSIDMFGDALIKQVGDARSGRLPVLLTARYPQGDATRTATGLYDIIWRTNSRLLRGHVVRMVGLRLRQRGGTQMQLDAAWTREKPRTS